MNPANVGINYEDSGTPQIPSKYLLRPRNLTKQGIKQRYTENMEEHKDAKKTEWDRIEAPQFIDFCNSIPSACESFFDKTVIVSTPIPSATIAEGYAENEDDTLVNSLNNISVSVIENDSSAGSHNLNGSEENSEQNETIQFVKIEASTPIKHDDQVKQLAVPIATKPFVFGNRGKPSMLNTAGVAGNRLTTMEQVYKKKVAVHNVNEETKPKPFKANPVPKYLKNRPPLIFTKPTRVKDTKTDINANEKKFQVTRATTLPELPKEQFPSTSKNMNLSDKPQKKRIEVWKQKPFIPQPTRTKPLRSQSPNLSSAIRAIERKRFDDIVQAKERERERTKRLEQLAKKQREEQEMVKLRELTVHKAQPIRRYKMGPQVQKRPITDPVTPTLLKRRRYK